MKNHVYKLLAFALLISISMLPACDTVNSDQEPEITREYLETLELQGDDVVIDLKEAFPNYTFNRVDDSFSDNTNIIRDEDGNVNLIRYIPDELFDQPFKMELTTSSGQSVVSSLHVRQGTESSAIEGCRENTTEFTVENGTKFILDLFEEEDFCEWKDKINTILITGGPRSFESTGPGAQGMRVTVDEDNPENNLLFFRYFFGSGSPPVSEATPATTGFVVAINYPEGTDVDDIIDNPELSEHYVERRMNVTVVPN